MPLIDRYSNDGVAEVYLNETQRREKHILLDKLKKGDYVEQIRSCSICSNESAEVIAEKDMFGLPIKTVLCESCGFLFTNPVMRESDYVDFYSSHYRRLYEGVEEPGLSISGEQSRRGQEIFVFVQKHGEVKPGSRVVELGCGAGGILKQFANEGYKVTGFDFDEDYLDFGRKQGLDLRNMSEFASFDEKVDLVISSHVLEHVHDLDLTLGQFEKLLKPSGFIYVEVPGLFNMVKTCKGNLLLFLQNAHLYHFTLASLCKLMAKRGFSLHHGTEYVRSIFRYEGGSMIEASDSGASQYKDVHGFIIETEKKYDKPRNRLKNSLRKAMYWGLRKTGLFSLARSAYYHMKVSK